MTIGIVVSKGQLDTDMAQTSLALRNAFRRIQQLRHYLLITPDATFTGGAFGYTPAEVTIFKSAFADADTLRQAWEGTLALPQQDYRLNLDQLAGDLIT
jgi:hypothetical protein